MNNQVVYFSDLLKLGRELKKNGVDKILRHIALKSFCAAGRIANKRYQYALDYYDGIDLGWKRAGSNNAT